MMDNDIFWNALTLLLLIVASYLLILIIILVFNHRRIFAPRLDYEIARSLDLLLHHDISSYLAQLINTRGLEHIGKPLLANFIAQSIENQIDIVVRLGTEGYCFSLVQSDELHTAHTLLLFPPRDSKEKEPTSLLITEQAISKEVKHAIFAQWQKRRVSLQEIAGSIHGRELTAIGANSHA